MSFIETLKTKARANKKMIVLPETTDIRTLQAAKIILDEGIANLTLLGEREKINALYPNLDLEKCILINPKDSQLLSEFIKLFLELREHKGMTQEMAQDLLLNNPLYFGTALVKSKRADGMVAGAINSTADVLRASLQIVGKKEDSKLVSSFFLMVVPNCNYGENGIFIFSDSGLVQNPNAEELAHIAVSSAQSFQSLIGNEPIVAMLSHSTKGSSKHPDVDKVIEATKIAQSLAPNFQIDGEFQLDAAIVPSIGASKAPNSKSAGRANVLIFPDLDAGNIGYKLVQRLANAEAYGPITQGIASPINDLSRGCSAEDIVGAVAITALQAN